MSYNKIYYDLKQSEYIAQRGNLKFYFSSVVRKEKFIDNIQEYIKKEKDYLKAKYKINIEENYLERILSLAFYKRCEKVGFRVFEGSNLLDMYGNKIR